MTFKDNTEIEPCIDEEETSKIPMIQFDFCQISQLNASLNATKVDIIGVVKCAGDCITIVSSKTQKEHKSQMPKIITVSFKKSKGAVLGAQN